MTEIVKLATWGERKTQEEALELAEKNGCRLINDVEADKILQDKKLKIEYADYFPCWLSNSVQIEGKKYLLQRGDDVGWRGVNAGGWPSNSLGVLGIKENTEEKKNISSVFTPIPHTQVFKSEEIGNQKNPPKSLNDKNDKENVNNSASSEPTAKQYRKCLHIQIARHPYKKTGWEIKIGDITGGISITTPDEDKQSILEEISIAMDELRSEETKDKEAKRE